MPETLIEPRTVNDAENREWQLQASEHNLWLHNATEDIWLVRPNSWSYAYWSPEDSVAVVHTGAVAFRGRPPAEGGQAPPGPDQITVIDLRLTRAVLEALNPGAVILTTDEIRAVAVADGEDRNKLLAGLGASIEDAEVAARMAVEEGHLIEPAERAWDLAMSPEGVAGEPGVVHEVDDLLATAVAQANAWAPELERAFTAGADDVEPSAEEAEHEEAAAKVTGGKAVPYEDLHVVPLPAPGNEGEDLNWVEWMVIGHADEERVSEAAVEALVDAFFAAWRAAGGDFPPEAEVFLSYAVQQGYVVFRPTRLRWAVPSR